MIYVHIHGHQWRETSRKVHGSRVYVCSVCGDRAFGFTPGEKPKRKSFAAAKRTDFPLCG